jgi:hypothetical protein
LLDLRLYTSTKLYIGRNMSDERKVKIVPKCTKMKVMQITELGQKQPEGSDARNYAEDLAKKLPPGMKVEVPGDVLEMLNGAKAAPAKGKS